MADLVELIFAKDGETLVRNDNGKKVDAKPIGKPNKVLFGGDAGFFAKREHWEPSARKAILNAPPERANAYIIGDSPTHSTESYYYANVQFYRIYHPHSFRELYEGIVTRIEKHPEVELRGQFVEHSNAFADVNVNLYVVPYHMIRDASELNEILHSLTPEGIEPTRRMDAFVQEEFHVLSFGVLGFEVEIGQKTTLKTYTGMMPEELLKVVDEGNAIEKGVYKAGIILKIFPHQKFVFQNTNGIWVPEKYSCGFYELDELENIDKKS